MITAKDFTLEDFDRLGWAGRNDLIEAVASGDDECVEEIYRRLHPQDSEVAEGEVQTNEEWFCSLPLTEKSDWLADFCKFIIESTEGGNDVKWATTKTYWDVWLNGAHHDMSGV